MSLPCIVKTRTSLVYVIDPGLLKWILYSKFVLEKKKIQKRQLPLIWSEYWCLLTNKLSVVLNFVLRNNLFVFSLCDDSSNDYEISTLRYAQHFSSNAIGSMNSLFNLWSNLLEKYALYIIWQNATLDENYVKHCNRSRSEMNAYMLIIHV